MATGTAKSVDDPMARYIGHPQGPDSTRSWWVATFAVLYVFFGWCAFSSSPVLYVALMETRPELSRETASWPFTIMSCCSFTGSAIYGILINYITERTLLLAGAVLSSVSLVLAALFARDVLVLSLTIGLAHGLGVACTTCIPSAVISQHFVKYRGTAMSMFSIAASLTGIVYPPLVTWLFRTYSLAGLLLLLAAICANQLLSAVVCDRAPWKRAMQRQQQLQQERLQQEQLRQQQEIWGASLEEQQPAAQAALASPAMPAQAATPVTAGFCSWFLVNTCVTNALANFIMFALILIIMDFENDNGIDTALGASLVVMLSLGWLIASLITGPIVDRGKYYDRYAIFSACIIQLIGLIIMATLKGDYWWQTVACLTVGWGQGSRGFLLFVMLSKRYPPSQAALAFAVMNLSCFLPFLLRTPLIGAVRDSLGQYDYLVYLFGVIDVLLAVDWLVLCITKWT